MIAMSPNAPKDDTPQDVTARLRTFDEELRDHNTLTAENARLTREQTVLQDGMQKALALIEEWKADAQSAEARNRDLVAALEGAEAFIAVMCGQGPGAIIPETVRGPLGVSIKVGKLMRDVRAALQQNRSGT